jgi:hypothetical protein
MLFLLIIVGEERSGVGGVEKSDVELSRTK